VSGVLEVREVGVDELDDIVALSNACDLADSGEIDLTRDDVRAGIAAAGSRAWALVDKAGRYRALVWIERNPSRPSQSAEFFVHPDDDPALGGVLVERLLAAQADDPAGRKLQVFVNASAPEKSAVLRSYGARIVRHFYKMAIALDGRVDAISWPPEASVRTVADTDAELRPVHGVVSEAFRDHWEHSSAGYEEWVARLRDRQTFDPSLVWLVEIAGDPAAALLAASSDGEGFIATLGVRRAYRGIGLARNLLHTSFAEFTRRGHPRAALFVDSSNPTGAVRLYESAGMHVVSRWDSHEFPAVASVT
jgi:mycothiol synthase